MVPFGNKSVHLSLLLPHLRPFAPATVKGQTVLELNEQNALRAFVEAFEEQGSGLFWEADADGRITYLSDTVIKALSVADIQAFGARLSDLLLLDTEGSNIFRTFSFHLVTYSAFKNYPFRVRPH